MCAFLRSTLLSLWLRVLLQGAHPHGPVRNSHALGECKTRNTYLSFGGVESHCILRPVG